MNRYLFWAIVGLPCLAFVFSTCVVKDTAHPWVFILNILALQSIAVNARRKQVGLGLLATIKAIVPGVGYQAWRRLYFAKP
ncbi:MAG: hypothetical protein LPK07_02915 [Hymenobacteraceae bacterium]|nr:hypothetical protein [Hymenobacteraceae bacterium]